MERIGASEEELRPQYPKPSDKLVNEYYGQLTDDQKLKVLRKLAPELKFYYMLFPPEKDTHKHILGIDANIFNLWQFYTTVDNILCGVIIKCPYTVRSLNNRYI